MFNKIKSIYNISEESNKLINEIDLKIKSIKITDKNKKKVYDYKRLVN